MARSHTHHDDQPRRTLSAQRKAGSAVSAIAAVALCIALAAPAAAQTIFTTTQQQPGFPQGQPQMPMPGGRGQQPNAADLPPGTATLRGHIFAADTGQALRKAQVRLAQQLDSQAGQMVMMMPRDTRLATTDAQGAYEFKELRPGRYTINASKGSYVALSYGQLRPTEPGKPIQVLDNQTIERVDISLPHGAIISGRILDEFGEPLSEVMVAPQRFQYIQGQRRLTGAGRASFTNDLGEFRIFGVPPGQYYLQATWRGAMPMGFGNADDKSGYAPLFFPGTLEASQAQRLNVAVGAEISDIVMTMRPIKAVTVTGSIVDSRGQPMNGMLMISQTDGMNMNMFTGAPVKPDGTFTLNGLAPGEYLIMAQQMGGNPQEAEVAMTKITVAGEDISGLQLAAAKPISTRGRVIVDPGAASSLPPRLMLQTSSPQMIPMIGMRAPTPVQDDMSFELKTPPGVYRLNLAPAGMGWTIRSIRRAASDVTDSGFEAKNGDDTILEVELTNKLTTITGLVTNARGEAAKDYTTIVFAQDSERWKGNTRYQSSGRPDQDGRFNITGLPPGDYYIIALERLETGEAGDPEFLEKIHTKASRLSLNEGETKTVDLRLNSATP